MRYCATPNCRTIVESGHCDVHRVSAWSSRSGQPERIRGTTLQRLRRQLFEREPLCRLCAALGRVTVATIRDHVVPLSEGGSDTEGNVQPLCQTCSDAKTRAESRRGVERHWGGM